MAKLNEVVDQFLRKGVGFEQLREAYWQDAKERSEPRGHLLKRMPGIPGVYDILQCVHCGRSARIQPEAVSFGVYPPYPNLTLPGPKCSGALEDDVPVDLIPAYAELFRVYQETDNLRSLVPNYRGGYWPRVDIGNWGVPMIRLWDGWSIELDQTVAAIEKTLPEGCGCGSNPCHLRVQVWADGRFRLIQSHGLDYEDQTTTPPELEGWEQFKELALLMYKLPQPADKFRKWFGRTMQSWDNAMEELRITGRPVYEVWEESGREIAWINAASRQLGRIVCRSITLEVYNDLNRQHPDAPGIRSCLSPKRCSCGCEDDLLEEEFEPYWELDVTNIPAPTVGTRIHFHEAGWKHSSESFNAWIYRATFDGKVWHWETAESSGRKPIELIFNLMDSDYIPCDRPASASGASDWYIS